MNAVALAIKIVTDAKGATAGIDAVTTKTSKMGTAGKLAGRALAAGLGLALVAGVAATKAAVADEAAQVKLAGALKNSAGARASDIASVESWISAQGKALGVADDELRPAMEALVTATGDVAKAQSLASVAMDISARKGISLESVSKTLAKAQATGNVAALAKYGVATKDAEGKTLSLEQVQKNLASTYNGAASAAAETAAGKQKRLQIAMGELQEEIGAKLLPILMKLTTAGLAVVDWITQNQTAAVAIIGTIGALLAIVKLVSIATTLWSTATKIMTVAQRALNIMMMLNPLGAVILLIGLLVAAVIIAYKKSDTFRAICDKAFRVVGDAAKWLYESAIKPAFRGIERAVEAVGKVGIWLWNNIYQPVFKFLLTGVGKVLDAWAAMLRTLGKVPGFGWAKTAADAMANAAEKATAVANSLGKIKDKSVTVTIRYQEMGRPGPYDPELDTGRAGLSRGAAGGGAVTINIPVTIERGFIGSERELASWIKRLLGNDLRRLAGAA